MPFSSPQPPCDARQMLCTRVWGRELPWSTAAPCFGQNATAREVGRGHGGQGWFLGQGGFAQHDTRGGQGVVGAQGHHVPLPGLMWVSRQVLGWRCCPSGASPSLEASCPPPRASSTWGASWGLAQHSPQPVSSEVSPQCPLGVPLVPAHPHTPAACTPWHLPNWPHLGKDVPGRDSPRWRRHHRGIWAVF